MVSLLERWEELYNDWAEHPERYIKTLTALEMSKISFNPIYAPWWLAGNWEITDNKILFISLNPADSSGKSKKKRGQDYIHNHWLNTITKFKKESKTEKVNVSWTSHKKFLQEYFSLAHKTNKSHSHYNRIAKLIWFFKRGYSPKKKEFYTMLNENAILGEVLPFYSKNTKKLRNMELLSPYWKLLVDFITESNFNKVIFSGKAFMGSNINKIFNSLNIIEKPSIEVKQNKRRKKSFRVFSIGKTKVILIPFLSNGQWSISGMKELSQKF